MAIKLVLVGSGGAAGALLRFGLGSWLQARWPGQMPVGTLAVNLIGCLLIGMLGALMISPRGLGEEYRLALMVGLLGAFTTFSAFGWETVQLLDERRFALAAMNVLASNALGLVGVWIGLRVSQRVFGL